MRLLFVTFLLAFVACPTSGRAEKWEIAGHVEVELRAFPHEPAFAEQEDATLSPSFALSPEIHYEWNESQDRLSFVPFARWDLYDDERTHADIRAAKWTHRDAGWDLVVGIDRVFWGAAESRHLVDVINQVDLVEDIDEEERLGQPMVNLNYLTDFGSFGFFVLPGFRERTFPAADARLRGLYPVLADEARYQSGAEQWHVDFAARWWHTFDGLDVGVAHFHGTGREPSFIVETRSGQTVFIPYYDQIDQTSIDGTYAIGSWLLKFEALHRSGQGDRFFAATGGFEYTFYGIVGARGDLGLLLEYHYDGRDQQQTPPGPVLISSYDRDIFVGVRLAFNDFQDTRVLAGALVDQRDQTTYLTLEAERRLASRWSVDLEGRFFVNVSPRDIALYGVRRDDYLLLRISYHL